MAKIPFNKDSLEKIKKSVQEAESKTSGEIAVAFTRESDNYASYELIFAVICGFVYFTVMMFFTGTIESRLQSMFWDYSVDYLLIFFGFSTFLVMALFYLLANLSFIDRLIVPGKVFRRKVNQRAVRHFMESGTSHTRDRTGILIFISELEHRVELLADRGISEKIEQSQWDDIVNLIVQGIKSGQMTENLIQAVGQCGDLLARHFPIQPDDVNELKDGVHILEN